MALSSGPKLGSSGSRRSKRETTKSNTGSAVSGKRKSVRKERGKNSAREKMPSLGGSDRSRRSDRSSRRSSVPAGTTDLAVSENTQRKRNRDVDEVASGRRSGRRVGDIRAAERAERNRKRYRSYIMKICIVVATVLIVVFGSIFIYRSSLLAVTNVTVSGASHLTDQEVTQLAAVPDDSTLFRLDSAGISSRLEEHPWVQKASVVRKFPNTVELVITERTPAAAVKLNNKNIWVISTDGTWLSAATSADWKNNRRIVDANSNMTAPTAGSECTDEGILNALAIYDAVSEKLLKQIKSISAESAVKTSLTLKSGISVAFGEATDIELKEADIWALTSEHEGKISYINVRVPDRPTYRTSK